MPTDQERIDAVSREILYPWVREALEQLAIMRDDCRRELGFELLSKHLKQDSVRVIRLRQHITRIDHILSQAFPIAMEKSQ